MVHMWSVLEQSAVVWSSSLSDENKSDIERTQKVFTKLALKRLSVDWITLWVHVVGKNLALILFIVTTSIFS